METLPEVVQGGGLIFLGFFTGAYGALVGLGGGFVLVPVLLMIYADTFKDPAIVTAISLTVIFLNSVSASWAYARMNRINYQVGIPFAIATVPGAILGAGATTLVDRHTFILVFGLFMIGMAAFLFIKPARGQGGNDETEQKTADPDGWAGWKPRVSTGQFATGLVGSLLVGFLSSFLGIGGGVLHVPMMIYVLHFPVHVATATSQFILAITSMSGAGTHLMTGTLAQGAAQAVFLSIGVIFGAQAGAHLSNRLHGVWIVRSLALAIGVVGVRFVYSAIIT
ncbi:MAG: sulfite exporter TauE/SafE family protein [Chloroflexaceae bacterium]|nr:sulfite exporter TauE/SafE family protein [Chloroflexaceae bacterium]